MRSFFLGVTMTISEAENRLLDWHHGKSGSFFTKFFNVCISAGPINLEKLAKGFPEEIKVFKMYRDKDGYLDDLLKRYETPLDQATERE